jgi:hypothetical protein
MTPQKKSDWKPEAFPQPRTIPTGWDTSSFANTVGKGGQDSPLAQAQNEEKTTDWVPEKFPKPRTFPKNWSVDD